MNIYYLNHSGEKIILDRFPIAIQNPESIFAHEWSFKSEVGAKNGGNITKFSKNIITKKVTLSVWAESKENFDSIMSGFSEITEKDVLSMTPGKLFVNEYYMKCYIYASSYSEYEEDFYTTDKDIQIVTEYPFWIKEESFSFYKNNDDDVLPGYDYPYDYLYDYTHDKTVNTFENSHYAPCEFSMTIYGPCSNPSVKINGNVYELKTILYQNEYVTIDSAAATIIKHGYRGDKINIFNSQRKDFDIFKKIDPGLVTVNWNTDFGFDITLYNERSEPRWK